MSLSKYLIVLFVFFISIQSLADGLFWRKRRTPKQPTTCEPELDACDKRQDSTPVCDIIRRLRCSCSADAPQPSPTPVKNTRKYHGKFRFSWRTIGCPKGKAWKCRTEFVKERVRCVRDKYLDRYLRWHPEDHLGTALGVCDVDECAQGTHQCSEHAICTNKAGCGWQPASYSCECKCGYVGDGKTCTECREPPHLANVPADVILDNGHDVPAPAAVTATGNCNNTPLEVKMTEEKVHDTDCLLSFVITRTWTAIDCLGRSSSATQRMTFKDEQGPVLSALPGNIDIACEATIPDGRDIIPTVYDNADPNPSWSMVQSDVEEPSEQYCSGRVTRTWSAKDQCGHSAVPHTQIITLIDLQAPTFTNPPADQVVACNAVPTMDKIFARDNCNDLQSTVTEELMNSDIDMDTCSGYHLKRTFAAVDTCGNEAVHTQLLTVSPDTSGPQLQDIPADMLDADNAPPCEDVSEIPALSTWSATDDCSEVADDQRSAQQTTEVNVPRPGLCTIHREYSAADTCGNSRTQTQIIVCKLPPGQSNEPTPTPTSTPDSTGSGGSDPTPTATPTPTPTPTPTSEGSGAGSGLATPTPTPTPSSSDTVATPVPTTSTSSTGSGGM
eukprot:TRINITY_DN70_c0_g1_i1.p1 TRINITY_DN70_c0_g1~~TRINITY_DN70_c0_g1_i1.p1  ORF type:complete len:613 (-),score=144.28 TRINITY_DN70_c0_g1_i1:382-2220(-)